MPRPRLRQYPNVVCHPIGTHRSSLTLHMTSTTPPNAIFSTLQAHKSLNTNQPLQSAKNANARSTYTNDSLFLNIILSSKQYTYLCCDFENRNHISLFCSFADVYRIFCANIQHCFHLRRLLHQYIKVCRTL